MVKKKIPIANIAVFILAIALFTSLFPLPFRAVSAQDPSEALVNCSDDFSDPERSKQLWRVNTHWSSIVTFEPGRLIIQNGDPFTETHVQLIFKFKDCFSFTEGTNYSISLSYRWEYDDSGAQFYMPPLQVRSRWFTVHFFNLTLRQEEGEAVGDYPFSDGSRYSKSTLASVGGWLLRWESTPTAAKRTGDLSLTDVSSGTVQLIKEGPVVTYYLNGVQLGQTDATLLEERTYRKQSLSFTVTGAAHLQDRGGGAFAGVVSRLVFEDFKIEGKPEDSVDISLKEIVPIQVIRDVPLVKDKATVVRAFVSLTGVSDLGNVPVSATVDFGGDVRTKNATLVPYGGTVYAFDDESIQANFIGWANTNNTRMIESLVSNRGIDAINFDFYPNPLRPNTNPVTIKVDIIPTGEFENRDSNLPNNSRSIQATVKDFENHLEIVFMRARPVWRDFTTAWFDFNNLVKEQYNWLVAMYPIPESKIVPIHVTGEILRVGGFFATGVPPTLWVSELVTTTTGWSGLEQVHLLAELTRLGGVMFPDAWKIVWVVPEGSMGGDGGVSYHYCKGTQSVLVNER